MTTKQTSLLEGDAAAQYRFVLCALIEDALRILRRHATTDTAASRAVYENALTILRDAATELSHLPEEDALPF